MPDFDLIIRGGTVIDGSRAPRFDADVGILGAASRPSAICLRRPPTRCWTQVA